MQVKMVKAKSQLSKLVKVPVAGEEVVIASHGKAQVKLVPVATESGLHQPGSLRTAMPYPEACDAAFSDSVEVELCALMNC